MKMNPYEAYKHYLALKTHFTSDTYDYFKYHGEVSVKPETFEKRNDKYMFHKLSKRNNMHDLILACMSETPKLWVGDIVADKGDKIYKEWLSRQDSMSYNFKNEILKMDDDFSKNFEPSDNNIPFLLWLFIRKEVSLETMCILEKLLSYIEIWESKPDIVESIDLVYDITVKKIKKYSPFVKIDSQKFKNLLRDRFKKS